jgi:hypothetical protein
MTIIKILNEVRNWLNGEICENFSFKKDPGKDQPIDAGYNYELVKPKAFTLYPPFDEKFPSVTVQFANGIQSKFEESGELKLRFLFATWNTGLHYKNGDKPSFKLNTEGWRDVWNFVDYTLRKLTNTNSISSNIRIKHEDKITFGPMTENETIPNYYPCWGAWIEFTIQYGINTTNEDITNLI